MDFALAAAVCAGVALVWLWMRSRTAGDSAEERLRHICLGNDMQMERLILAEMRRAPGITRADAASRAVRRYERDNR